MLYNARANIELSHFFVYQQKTLDYYQQKHLSYHKSMKI